MGLLDTFRRPKLGGPTEMRARLEGAMSKRRLRGWNPPLENINALVASGGPKLLARSRELVVTNGYAANACEAFASNMVGDGIKPSSLIEDAALRDEVQRLWLAWLPPSASSWPAFQRRRSWAWCVGRVVSGGCVMSQWVFILSK